MLKPDRMESMRPDSVCDSSEVGGGGDSGLSFKNTSLDEGKDWSNAVEGDSTTSIGDVFDGRSTRSNKDEADFTWIPRGLSSPKNGPQRGRDISTSSVLLFQKFELQNEADDGDYDNSDSLFRPIGDHVEVGDDANSESNIPLLDLNDSANPSELEFGDANLDGESPAVAVVGSHGYGFAREAGGAVPASSATSGFANYVAQHGPQNTQVYPPGQFDFNAAISNLAVRMRQSELSRMQVDQFAQTTTRRHSLNLMLMRSRQQIRDAMGGSSDFEIPSVQPSRSFGAGAGSPEGSQRYETDKPSTVLPRRRHSEEMSFLTAEMMKAWAGDDFCGTKNDTETTLEACEDESSSPTEEAQGGAVRMFPSTKRRKSAV